MKLKFVLIFLLAFIAGFTFLYFESSKIKYLSVFLPHREKNIVKPLPETKDESSKIFYGVNVDMSQLLPTSSHYVVNSRGEDLIDIAHNLGINLFRITSVTPSFGKTGFIYTKAQWDSVLDRMNKNGIQALILIESPALNPNDYSKNYLDLVDSYIINSRVLEDPDVYGVDIKNEPLLSNTNLAVMAKAAKMIKDKYPNTKITVGGWKSNNPEGPQSGDPYIYMDAKEGKKLSSFVDFYSVHTYNYDKALLGVYPDSYNLTLYSLNKFLPILDDKPILIEEFGAGNGDAITDQQTIGSKELQANAYDGVYQAVIDLAPQKLIGSVAYLFLKRNPNVDSWAIIKDNGNYIFPAAYVLQKYSKGESDVALDLPFRKLPTDFLLSNADNGKTINVKLQDIVGLHLRLNTDFINMVSVSNPSMVLKTEPLIREDNGEFIDTVFHITKIGKTTIKIIGRNSSGTVTRFSVTIEASN